MFNEHITHLNAVCKALQTQLNVETAMYEQAKGGLEKLSLWSTKTKTATALTQTKLALADAVIMYLAELKS